uniref:Uncharacterized protein n=1 Tax=Meloidogyne incognita TaxID=6306 RepID=A0A914M4L6_MELIC
MNETFLKITFILALVSFVITKGDEQAEQADQPVKPPSVDECTKIMESNELYKFDDCLCMQDLDICKYSAVVHKICEKDTLLNYFKNLSTCDVVLKDCASADINDCSKEMCECFTTFITCMNEKKCTPLPAKSDRRVRNIGSVHGFGDFVRGHVAKVADDLNREE